MNSFLMKFLFIIAIIGMLLYLELFAHLWQSVSVNPDATFGAFFLNYWAAMFGAIWIYLIPPIFVLIFKGRSFKRYIISVFILMPILFGLGMLGNM